MRETPFEYWHCIVCPEGTLQRPCGSRVCGMPQRQQPIWAASGSRYASKCKTTRNKCWKFFVICVLERKNGLIYQNIGFLNHRSGIIQFNATNLFMKIIFFHFWYKIPKQVKRPFRVKACFFLLSLISIFLWVQADCLTKPDMSWLQESCSPLLTFYRPED